MIWIIAGILVLAALVFAGWIGWNVLVTLHDSFKTLRMTRQARRNMER